jgi:hypothetical protein
MQQRQVIAGFSDLKELLIRTYEMRESRELIRLHFSASNNQLLMHDYNDHKKFVILCRNIIYKVLVTGLSQNAYELLMIALDSKTPINFLNEQFKLNGFFKL